MSEAMMMSGDGRDSGRDEPAEDIANATTVGVDGAVWLLARSLAGAATPNDVALAVAEHGATAAAASFSNIAMVDHSSGRVRAIHRSNLDPSVAERWSEIDLGSETPLGDAISQMVPVLLPSLETIRTRYPGLLDETVAAGLEATASWPLRGADGTILGSVGFGWNSLQEFDPRQCLGLSLIADLTAQALDRAHLYSKQTEAARRIQLLQRLTERFASATTAQEIAEVAIAEVAPLVGASIVNVTRVEGNWVEHIADTQLPDRFARIPRRPLSDRVPSTDAARTGRPVILPTHADRIAAYPDERWVADLADSGTVVAFPAIVNSAVVGTLALVFPPGVELSEDDLAYLATICDQCGQALVRVNVTESLRKALAGETRRALLAEATSDLAISLSVTDSLQRLARLVIPELADWVIIDLADENAQPHQVAMLHRDGHQEAIERFSALQLTGLTEQAPIMRVLATGLPILHAETSIDVAAPFVTRPELIEICDRLGICSVMYVPMVARGRTLGCLTLVTGVSARHYDQQDLEFAMGLAQRAALVVDNSSLYEREHQIANLLQESLLPVVPRIPGLDIAVRYRPSDTHAQVGGDFYDALSLPDGSTALVVGDVMGHDLVAATTMGQLRSHLRACAWEAAVNGASDPGAILDHTDRLVHGLALTGLATAFYAKIERELTPDPTWTLTYATAGHPMPLIRWPDGRATELEAKGMAMGVSATARRSSRRTAVPEGSILVAFTDGLVERRNRDWSEGVESVRRALEITPTEIETSVLAEKLLNVVPGKHFDDTVVLVVRFA